jgi:hypothetical protein
MRDLYENLEEGERVKTEYEVFLHTAAGREGPHIFRTLAASHRWLQWQDYDVHRIELWQNGRWVANVDSEDEKVAA